MISHSAMHAKLGWDLRHYCLESLHCKEQEGTRRAQGFVPDTQMECTCIYLDDLPLSSMSWAPQICRACSGRNLQVIFVPWRRLWNSLWVPWRWWMPTSHVTTCKRPMISSWRTLARATIPLRNRSWRVWTVYRGAEGQWWSWVVGGAISIEQIENINNKLDHFRISVFFWNPNADE